MAQDWRLALCTRWRPLVIFILSLALFAGCLVLIPFVQDIGRIPTSSLPGRAEKLRIGMSEQELIKIMGKPIFTRTFSAGQNRFLQPWESKEIEDAIQKYGPVVKYGFGRRKFGRISMQVVEGILLDQEKGKIIDLRIRSSWWKDHPPTREVREILLAFAFSVALSWISPRLCCKRLK